MLKITNDYEAFKVAARLKRITEYQLPPWNKLPKDIRSREFQDFIQDELGWLFPEEKLLTGYMLQNYLKWGVLLDLEGRKYSREHVAWTLTITLLKRVIALDEIKEGIILQKKLMSEKQCYEVFRQEFHRALVEIFSPIFAEDLELEAARKEGQLDQGELVFKGLHVDGNRLAVAAVCRALAWQILTTTILAYGGWQRLAPYIED
ncbi:MAG: DUF1836 domain-containing protein [Eubacteriales bacterium]|nr:DUF1836 domain-containing protein [Eubacteriales bacterium]